MSSYVVSNRTINMVLSHLLHSENHRWYGQLLSQGAGFGLEDGWLGVLGKAMWDLNVEAVRARYEDCRDLPPEELPGDGEAKYEFRYELCPSRIQAFKHLQCWLYQCSEGAVPKDPLYATMERVAHNLAEEIIQKLPEYDRADWGAKTLRRAS